VQVSDLLHLLVGDPTVFGNFNVDDICNEAVLKHVKSFKANGYPPAHGMMLQPLMLHLELLAN
jgi:tyrosine aminotransferase